MANILCESELKLKRKNLRIFPLIQTKRLELKEITVKYRNDLLKLFQNEELMELSGLVIDDPLLQVDVYITLVRELYEYEKGVRWAVIDKETDKFIGDIGLFNIDFNSCECEVGYTILKEYWKQGYGFESVNAALNFAYNIFRIKKINAKIDTSNVASIALAKKLGFIINEILPKNYYNENKKEFRDVYSFVKEFKTFS